MIIGIISDTHGILSEDALQALKGVDSIVHAGDVGGPQVLEYLGQIAPVTAVRGNMDHEAWAEPLPAFDMIGFDGTIFYVLHDLHTLDLDPSAAGVQIVVSGHTHQAAMKTVQGVLYFNPGSASHGRHGMPLSVGRIELTDGRIHPQIIQLN